MRFFQEIAVRTQNAWFSLRDEESGQTLVEYALIVAADAVHPNDNTEYVNAGMEYAWNEIVFLRGGWKSLFERETQQRVTLGAGLHYRIAGSVGVAFDYAYQDWGSLKSVHYLTFGVEF